MFALLRDLDTQKYTHRTYVVSSGDAFSAQRAAAFERELEERATSKRSEEQEKGVGKPGPMPRIAPTGQTEVKQRQEAKHHVGPRHYTIATIPRARRVHQPLYTTPFSALQTLLSAFSLFLSTSGPDHLALPNLVVTNGPATAVIVVLAAFILRFFNIRGAESESLCRTVYVESFARVKTLSLSGKLLVRVVDRFLVQWEELEGYAGRAEYCGILV
jgi:beta-1,4-N-acetylglucosaminyltransferase